jgi:hypothetical protein
MTKSMLYTTICSYVIFIVGTYVGLSPELNSNWGPSQGCQMVSFQTKSPKLGKFWRALQWKMTVCIFYGHLVQFTVFCYILWTFGIVRVNLVNFSLFWYLEPRKVWQPWSFAALLDPEKSKTEMFQIFNQCRISYSIKC